MPEKLAPPFVRRGKAVDAPPPRRLPSTRGPRGLPFRSAFHRTVRLVGMAALVCSALGLLASVAGLPLNPLSMLAGLLLSLVLIGFTARPSLRKPKF